MKIALCDDSKLSRMQMYDLCMRFFAKATVTSEIDRYSSGKELLAASVNYDLILLDVFMPEMTGIEVGRALRKLSKDTEIIFITSFAEYAINGYQVQAFSYLLKNDLEQTFETCMRSVLEKIKAKKKKRLFRFIEGYMSIFLDELMYIESRASRLIFHMHSKENARESTYHLYGKMDDLQTELSSCGFIRTNQSFLVNAAHIKKLKCYETELTNGEVLSVPKARYGHVREQYALHEGG